MDFDQYLLVIWSVLGTLAAVVKASENLAYGKATDQSSVFGSWDSSKAVDGYARTVMMSDCCAHTDIEPEEVWWHVDLKTTSSVDTVEIIYRDEGVLRRLAGYEIYLSDTPDWTSGTRCHKDDTPDLASMSATQNIQCPGVARYLTIYNDRRVKDKDWYSNNAILELCEVHIYGCPIGKYGHGNCNNDCLNCLNDICDTSSGICDTCVSGYYINGSACTSCPANCAGNTCDNLTGTCLGGCKSGLRGTYCRCPLSCKDADCPTSQCTDCNDGYFGPVCTPCSSGCRGSICDKNSGQCFGCYGGLHGVMCNQNCPGNWTMFVDRLLGNVQTVLMDSTDQHVQHVPVVVAVTRATKRRVIALNVLLGFMEITVTSRVQRTVKVNYVFRETDSVLNVFRDFMEIPVTRRVQLTVKTACVIREMDYVQSVFLGIMATSAKRTARPIVKITRVPKPVVCV